MPEELGKTIGTFEYDNLFAGVVQPIASEAITMKAGQAYMRGSVITKDADGKGILIDSAAGGQPYGILADNVDATEEDRETVLYLTGEFNQDALIFGGTDTYETHKEALRDKGIFLKKTY